MISLKSVGLSRTGGLVLALLSALAGSAVASAQTLTTLISFSGGNGQYPDIGSLIADASGNLFGNTDAGGVYGYGTVFEIANSGGVYAGTPTTLVSFDNSDGAYPTGALLADANGNLFGTTVYGGASGSGTVFEIVNSGGVYAGIPTPLVSFNGNDGGGPAGGLLTDANGNLFGTTEGGSTYGYGTVFEIVKTSSGYESTPTTLVSFDNSDGAIPWAGLIADANGNLFGTTIYGGTYGYGTVFEIANSGGVYAGTPTTLVSFNNSDGKIPIASLIADANGNLFGITVEGGLYGDGTVFEIAKTSSGYASTPTTLVNFNGNDGAVPETGLIADANGNLFGTTGVGGASNYGTVFELAGSGFVPPSQFAGTPGSANCIGKSISTLAHTYGGIAHAASALGYSSATALESAIANYCGN